MKTAWICAAVLFAPLSGADSLRDPTRPPAPRARAAAAEPAPVLSAIMGQGGDRIAIFNGRIARRGAMVGSYFIAAIRDDGVTYRHAGLTRDLSLPRTANFKTPPASAARQPMGSP
jgi:hypothetical protein